MVLIFVITIIIIIIIIITIIIISINGFLGGLVYSHDLQTCDWPRNVACKPIMMIMLLILTMMVMIIGDGPRQ